MVRASDKITRPRSARDGRVQCRIQDALRLLERIELPKVAKELKKAQVARQGRLADASKYPQVGLEQREQTLGPIFMDVTPRVFLLGVIDEVMRIALECPIAAGRIRIEPTARLDGEVGRLLDCLHRKISGRLDDNSPLTTDPGNNRGPVFVVVPPAGLAFLAASTRAASQYLLPAMCRLALVPGSMIEVIRFHRAFQLAVHLIGEGRIPEPPAPAVAGPTMDTQLSGTPPRRTRETEEKRRQNPMHDRALAAIQERSREVIEGTLTGLLFTAVALQAGLVVEAPHGPTLWL